MLIASIHFVFQYPKSLNVRYLPDNFEHYKRRFRRKGQYFWRWEYRSLWGKMFVPTCV